MLERKAYADLVAWKERSRGSSALLVEGVRRVGKTTLVRAFGEAEYRSCLFIDFHRASPGVRELFDEMADDLDSLFSYLSGIYGVTLHERETLIVFDEVQFFPRARGLVKYLVEDGRFDYVETGSLVSIRHSVADILIPSEEERLELNPLDFEEFCWAMGARPLADAIRAAWEAGRPLPDSLHKKASRLVREYMLVGGMPAALAAYADGRDFHAAEDVKRQVVSLYREDVARFARGYEHKVASVFDEIPSQLSKHEKKFTLASLGKNARSRSYEEAFFWLADARVANLCYNTTDPNVGLRLNEDRPTLKCYMADTGLLVTHAFSENGALAEGANRDILLGKLHVNEGMLAENLVAQMLRAAGHGLWFYSRAGTPPDRMEIDFLLSGRERARVTPVEVKSTRRYTTTSLDKFEAKFHGRVGEQLIVHPGQLAAEPGRIRLPFYMAWLL